MDVKIGKSFADISRTTTGTRVEGRLGRIQGKTPEEIAEFRIAEVLSTNIFERIPESVKAEIRNDFVRVPGYVTRNPDLMTVALLYSINNTDLDPESFGTLKKYITFLQLNKADLLRYVRFAMELKKQI